MVWGEYVGSVTKPGLVIVNPVGTELKTISTARQTMDIKELKVVDAKGNPIMISGNLAYRVYSVKKARVDVADAHNYIYQQAPMVLRKVASRFTYDMLRGDSHGEVEGALRSNLQEAVSEAGVEVLKFDLTDLSYAPEIAQAMLAKQQADAMVEARRLVSQAAVGIACDAAEAVKTRGHELSNEAQEKLITNLLTVIVSHSGVTPTTSM
jgi:regulator of protease activity HflC (stomatin/prohibitin superfamily)